AGGRLGLPGRHRDPDGRRPRRPVARQARRGAADADRPRRRLRGRAVRTLAARIVVLAVVVALASAAVTTLALARSSAAARRDQAAAQLQQDAQALASLADGGRPAVLRANRLRLRARGVDSVVV